MKKPIFALAFVALLASAAGAHAQTTADYPTRTVTLIVPTAAGGGTDVFARLFADRLSKMFNQTFIVDNKPGANGINGTGVAARAEPDGYTLLFTYAAAYVGNPALMPSLPYDVEKAFDPIAQIGSIGNMLLVPPDFPAKNLPEFIAYVKARPGKLNYCSWGQGSGGHFLMESLKKQAAWTCSTFRTRAMRCACKACLAARSRPRSATCRRTSNWSRAANCARWRTADRSGSTSCPTCRR